MRGSQPPSGSDSDNSQNKLAFLLSECRWDDAISRLRSHPSEASELADLSPGTEAGDGNRDLPLHVCCRLRPPPSVVEALLTANPSAASLPGGNDAEESLSGVLAGPLPLHIAVSHDSADAIAPLLECHPRAAMLRDSTGRLPVHLVCMSSLNGDEVGGGRSEVLEELLMVYPEGLYERDTTGKTAADYAKVTVDRAAAQGSGREEEFAAVLERGEAFYTVARLAFHRAKAESDESTRLSLDALRKEHADKIEYHRMLEEELRSSHVEAIGVRRQLMKTAVEEHNAHVTEVTRKQSAKCKELEKKHSQEVDKFTKKHESELELRKTESEALRSNVMQLQEEVDASAKEREREIQDIKLKHSEMIHNLTSEKNSEIRALTSDKSNKIYDLMNAKDTLRLQLIKLENVEETLQAKVYQLERELKRRSDEMEESTEMFTRDLQAKNEEMSRQRDDFGDKMRRMYGEYQKKLKKKSAQLRERSGQLVSMAGELKVKSDEIGDKNLQLNDMEGKLEVLLRNLDSLTRHNIEQVRQIESHQGTILALTGSVASLTLPLQAMIERAKAEQEKALQSVAMDPDLVLSHVGEVKDKVYKEVDEIIEYVKRAELKPTRKVIWEHLPELDGGDDMSCASHTIHTVSTLGASVAKEELIAAIASIKGTGGGSHTSAFANKMFKHDEQDEEEEETTKIAAAIMAQLIDQTEDDDEERDAAALEEIIQGGNNSERPTAVVYNDAEAQESIGVVAGPAAESDTDVETEIASLADESADTITRPKELEEPEDGVNSDVGDNGNDDNNKEKKTMQAADNKALEDIINSERMVVDNLVPRLKSSTDFY